MDRACACATEIILANAGLLDALAGELARVESLDGDALDLFLSQVRAATDGSYRSELPDRVIDAALASALVS